MDNNPGVDKVFVLQEVLPYLCAVVKIKAVEGFSLDLLFGADYISIQFAKERKSVEHLQLVVFAFLHRAVREVDFRQKQQVLQLLHLLETLHTVARQVEHTQFLQGVQVVQPFHLVAVHQQYSQFDQTFKVRVDFVQFVVRKVQPAQAQVLQSTRAPQVVVRQIQLSQIATLTQEVHVFYFVVREIQLLKRLEFHQVGYCVELVAGKVQRAQFKGQLAEFCGAE